jgi:hypothetical protein
MYGRQSSVSGFFKFKLDNASRKDLTSTARIGTDEEETKLDGTLHTSLK